jgi:glycine/D-amino acid oxidase-like deaminating enzyme
VEQKFDAIVIGAGVMGSAIAFELARGGRTVCVIDKGAGPGQGSTSASSAVLRFNYTTFDATALAWEAFHCWLDWQNHLEAPSAEGLVHANNIGMVMLEVPIANFERTAMLFEQVGIEYEIAQADRLKELIPGVDTGKYWPPKQIDDPEFWEEASEQIRGMYTPQGGYVSDPMQSAVNLADAAIRNGVVFKYKTRVNEICKEDGRVCCVATDSGETINAPIIVNAAGPWSGQINELAGAGSDFTVTTRPMRQEVHHVPAPSTWINPPCYSDLDTGVYIRPEAGGGMVIGGTEPECDPFQWVEDPDEVNMNRTQELFNAQVTRAARRLPDLQVPSTAAGVVGVYDVSTDWSPIYDKSDVPGFYLAIGTSGNQFKNAPTTGQIMAAIIDAVESGIDHDNEPVQFVGKYTGLTINTGTFSRKREKNEFSTGTVLG